MIFQIFILHVILLYYIKVYYQSIDIQYKYYKNALHIEHKKKDNQQNLPDFFIKSRIN